MTNEIIEKPVPLSDIEGGGVITDIDTKIGTTDDGTTGSVLGKLNYLMENIGKGGLKSKVLVDITALDALENMFYRTTIDADMLPKIYAFHLKMNCDVYNKTSTKENVLINAICRPPFERYFIINSDSEFVLQSPLRYYPAQNAGLYASINFGSSNYETCTITLPGVLLSYDEALTAWNISELYELKLTAYYFDSTPVDTE